MKRNKEELIQKHIKYQDLNTMLQNVNNTKNTNKNENKDLVNMNKSGLVDLKR